MADYEDTKVTDLVINNMSQEKFEELKAAGELDPTQIYLTPTEESGGVSLPDQTDNAGKFLTTDGTTASWGEALSNHGTHAKSIAIGYNKQISTWTGDIYIGTSNSLLVTGKGVGGVIVIGDSADTLNDSCFDSIAIGKNAKIGGKSAIQLGHGKNEDAHTFKVGNTKGNFEIMSADGTIPTDRYTTTPTTAGTYVPKLTIAGDGTATREWGAESGGAGGDYLPLSGGEISGAINYNAGELTSYTWSDKPLFTATFSSVGGVQTYTEAGLYASANGLCLGHKGSSTPMLSFLFSQQKIEPYHNAIELGSASNIFKSIATKKIVSGIDTSDYTVNEVIVPQKKGTMALKEDIQEALKNITVDDDTDSVALGHEASGVEGIAIGAYSKAGQSTAIGYAAESLYGGLAIGDEANAGTLGIALGYQAVAGDTEFVVGIDGNNIKITDHTGLFPRERMSALVEVLPTAENGYTTVKNYGNGYVEITGYTTIGTVGASTGSEVQIDLPAGYTMANANYWVNIAPTSETTMFDFKAEAKARSTTHFMVAYKNEDDATGLTAAGVYWEVRGMLATE